MQISPLWFWDRQLCEYNISQRRYIDDLWLSILYGHGLGITLARPVHKLFHNVVKRKDITPKKFEEFTKRFLNGEYSYKFYYPPMRDQWLSAGIPASFIDGNFKLLPW